MPGDLMRFSRYRKNLFHKVTGSFMKTGNTYLLLHICTSLMLAQKLTESTLKEWNVSKR